ncbi:MAG: ABC transporter permease subunit [Chlorobia bacterium]|nr:ABC transporter permease subunit [Fimbriimonadaceae bacterium]
MTEVFVFQAALRDFLRIKRIIVWILVAFALFGISKVFLYVNQANDLAEAYSMLSSLLVFRVLPLASAIFSSAVIGQEVEQKTIVYLLTRPVERWKLVLFRTLASAVAVSLVSVVTLALVSAAVYGSPFSNPMFFRDLVAILVGSLAYGTLFVFVTLLMSKAAMVVCLLFAFAWETAVPNMPGSMSSLSVSTYLSAIAQRPSALGGGGFLGNMANALGVNAVSAQTGWMILALMIAFFGGLGMWWFSTFEFLPREDAE